MLLGVEAMVFMPGCCRGGSPPVALREDDGSEVDTAGSDEMEWETTRVTCAEVMLAIRERSR